MIRGFKTFKTKKNNLGSRRVNLRKYNLPGKILKQIKIYVPKKRAVSREGFYLIEIRWGIILSNWRNLRRGFLR